MHLIAKVRRGTVSFLKKLSAVFVFGGLLFGRTTEPKQPSVPMRIAAVQKVIQQLPAHQRDPLILSAQWGNWNNWANWVNWNNWGNWANWNNWNNWGNWSNY